MKISLTAAIIFLFTGLIFGQKTTWYVFPQKTPENAIRHIYVDPHNTKWIGGYDYGLHKLQDSIWTHYTTDNSGISDDDVHQSCVDTAGNLWIATDSDLSTLDPKTGNWTNHIVGLGPNSLYSIEIDDKNRIWVGTGGGSDQKDGLYMYNGTFWTLYEPSYTPLTGKWILDLKKGPYGKIWGCHYQGLFEIQATTITNHLLTSAGFGNNTTATCVDFDSDNNKWVAVYDGGIGKFDGTNWTIYTPSNSPLPSDKIWSIAVDQNDIVWIGTENHGLVKFDGTDWTIYDDTNSPISSANRIDALTIDTLGNLWIGNSYGRNTLIIHNPEGILNVMEGVNIQVYPNPVYDISTIKIGNNLKKEEYLLEIFNINGVKIISQKIDEQFSINRESYVSGIYFYRISKASKIIKTDKIIIL